MNPHTALNRGRLLINHTPDIMNDNLVTPDGLRITNMDHLEQAVNDLKLTKLEATSIWEMNTGIAI